MRKSLIFYGMAWVLLLNQIAFAFDEKSNASEWATATAEQKNEFIKGYFKIAEALNKRAGRTDINISTDEFSKCLDEKAVHAQYKDTTIYLSAGACINRM